MSNSDSYNEKIAIFESSLNRIGRRKRFFFILKFFIFVIILGFIIYQGIKIGYKYEISGFNVVLRSNDLETPQKYIWDWLDLLVVPVVLALGGILITFINEINNREIAAYQRHLDRDLDLSNKQKDFDLQESMHQIRLLSEYLSNMSKLMLDYKLRQKRKSVRDIANAWTINAMMNLNKDNKGEALRFLYNSDLISGNNPVVNVSEMDFSETILKASNLSGANLSGIILNNSDLNKTNLSGTNLTNAKLSDADLSEAIINDINFTSAEGSSIILSDCNIHNLEVHRVKFPGAILENVNIYNSSFNRANFRELLVKDSDISEFSFNNCELQESYIDSSELLHTRINNSQLTSSKLNQTNFFDVKFVDCDLSYCRFDNCKLDNVEFINTKLQSAIFLAIDLINVDLSNKDLRKINFYKTNFNDSKLDGADMRNSYLFRSTLLDHQIKVIGNLEGAILPNGSLFGTQGVAKIFSIITTWASHIYSNIKDE